MVKKFPKEKTPELYQAKRALISYLRSNNLDPGDKTLLKDPVHGPILTDLVNKLNKERDKVMANYPALDRSNNLKLLKMAKENKKAKKAKKVQEVAAAQETKKEKKSAGRTSSKYDYPQVKDEATGKMREMNSTEKKKYRMEQRKAANGGTAKKTKKDEAPAKAVKAEKKAKKEKETPKAEPAKKDKKKKKAKNDED